MVTYMKRDVMFAVKREMPKFVKKPEPVECMEYTEAKFETMVTGQPEPNIEWFVSLIAFNYFHSNQSVLL